MKDQYKLSIIHNIFNNLYFIWNILLRMLGNQLEYFLVLNIESIQYYMKNMKLYYMYNYFINNDYYPNGHDGAHETQLVEVQLFWITLKFGVVHWQYIPTKLNPAPHVKQTELELQESHDAEHLYIVMYNYLIPQDPVHSLRLEVIWRVKLVEVWLKI